MLTPSISAPVSEERQKTSKRNRIVCVDNDRDTCDLMEVWLDLAPFDYDVEAVETSQQALDLVSHHDADLYVLDSSVEGETPRNLLQTIRQHDNVTPVLIVSGRAYDYDRKEALAEGANGYLVKPVTSEQFVAAVEQLLQQR